MSNLLETAATKIANLASLPISIASASGTVEINNEQTRQTSRERKLAEFLEYSEHIGYIKPSDDTLYLYDKLRTGTAITLNNYEIESITAKASARLVKTFNATVNKKDFVRNNNTPQIKESPITVSVATNQDGEYQDIKAISEPYELDSGQVVFNNSNISVVLTRKASVYLSDTIEVITNLFQQPQIGDIVSFDTTFDDRRDIKKGSGSMVIVGTEYITSKLQTKLIGLGSFTEA